MTRYNEFRNQNKHINCYIISMPLKNPWLDAMPHWKVMQTCKYSSLNRRSIRASALRHLMSKGAVQRCAKQLQKSHTTGPKKKPFTTARVAHPLTMEAQRLENPDIISCLERKRARPFHKYTWQWKLTTVKNNLHHHHPISAKFYK